MITLLLGLHIVLMTLSLIATSSMVGMALASYGTPAWFLKANFIGTMVGIASGTILLFTQPLDMRCVLLAGYLVFFGLAYSFVRRRMVQLAAVDIAS
jgi:hypothetical protein